MCAQAISLTWDNHHSLLINVFNELLESNIAVNCTIVAEGHQVKAHQVLLSSFSPFFELLFKEANQDHPIIILADTSYQDLRALIHYMYQGKLDIPHDQIKSILETAKYLQIRGVGGASKDDRPEKANEDLSLQSYSNPLKLERIGADAVKPAQNIIERPNYSDCTQHQTLPASSVYHAGQLSIHCMSSDEAHKESSVQGLPSSPVLSTTLSSEPNTLPLYKEPVIKVEPLDETFSAENLHPNELEGHENEEMNLYDSNRNSQHQGAREEANICFPTNVSVKREENNEYVPLQECAFSMFNLPSSEIPSPVTSRRMLDVPSACGNSSRDSPSLFVDPADLEPDELYHSELDLKPEDLSREEIAMLNRASFSSMEHKETLVENERIASMTRDFSCVKSQRVTSSCESSWPLQIPASSKTTVQEPIALRATGDAETIGMQHVNTTRCLLKHVCPECQKSFRFPSLLRDHMRKHGIVHSYKCVECDFVTAYKSHLDMHRRIHPGDRPHKCNECEYAADFKYKLIMHRRIHTGERPYKCNECDYAAADVSTFRRHLRTHTGERPYKCNECEYAASQKGSLMTHLRIHSGVKPYKCPQCNYAASRKSGLMLHSRVHTGERL